MDSVNDLATLITSELAKYSDEVDEALQDEIDKTADDVVKNLKSNPIIPAKTGRYKKSFYKKVIAQGKGYKRTAVANRIYQLTHLLDKEHPTRNGGRSKAYPHWSEAEKVSQELFERMERRLQS